MVKAESRRYLPGQLLNFGLEGLGHFLILTFLCIFLIPR